MATPHRTLRLIPAGGARTAEVEERRQPGAAGRAIVIPRVAGGASEALADRVARAGFTAVLYATTDREAVVAAYPEAVLVTPDRVGEIDAVMDGLFRG